MLETDYTPDALDVEVAELLVATADAADPLLSPLVQQALRYLREKMGMDVVFVSRFVDGERRFEAVDRAEGAPDLRPGQSDPLEKSWCQFVVDGRLPEFIPDARPLVAAGRTPPVDIEIGTHLSAPVRGGDGNVFGTLCCFSTRVQPAAGASDLARLRHSARLIADMLSAPGATARG